MRRKAGDTEKEEEGENRGTNRKRRKLEKKDVGEVGKRRDGEDMGGGERRMGGSKSKSLLAHADLN